jgi:drug/metabolite transporter (DMT)-like permease
MTGRHELSKAVPITLTACLFLSFSACLVRMFDGKFPTAQIVFIQNFVGFLIILPIVISKGTSFLRTKVFYLHLLRDLFGVASYFFFFLAIRLLDLINATILNYTSPLIVPLIWRIWTGEKIKRRTYFSLIIGFFGAILILNPTSEVFEKGFVFGLLGSMFSACALCALRLLNVEKEPKERTLIYLFLVSTLLSLPFAYYEWIQPNLSEALLSLLLGIFTALAQISLTIGYRYGCAPSLSPLAYSIVVFNLGFAFIFFEEQFSPQSFLGSVLVVFGGILTFLWNRKKTPCP